MNKTVIKKVIKEDHVKEGIQVLLTINKENDITMAIAQGRDPVVFDLSYNQLCSLSRIINSAIDNHYQEYSNTMEKEKTAKIYIDDPIDW